MPSALRTDGPRHMAGHPHRSADSAPGGVAPAATHSVERDTSEIPPAARVHRSRLAIALAVTLAALPILVLDNFAASADEHVDVAAAVTTVDAPTTTVASTTSAALATSVAPATTEAPTTTAAPTTTTTTAPVRALAVAESTTTTAPPTTQAPPPPSGENGDPNDPATWDRMAQCEAGGNWAANTGNGYYGGLQFSVGSWQRYGGTGYPHQASKATQIEIGKRLQAAEGWGAWPGCSRELGYT